jgi:hypothetical protein
MASVEVSLEIAADPDVVWPILVGIDHWVEIITAIEDVERLDDGTGFGPGTTWRETRTMFGKKATEVMEVTEYEDGVRYATFAESHGSKYYSEMRVDPAAGGCRLSMNFRGEPQTLLTKIVDATVGRFVVGATRKALAKDLADIKAAAESAG